jgi:hypothetical protein
VPLDAIKGDGRPKLEGGGLYRTPVVTIQRVELYDGMAIRCPQRVHCPHCGGCVFETASPTVTPCEHTLFVATDAGFEFRSKTFNGVKRLSEHESPQLIDEESFDDYTDQVQIPNSIKFALFSRAMNGLGVYIGFAPYV